MTQTIWITHISHKHGDTYFANATPEGANAAKIAWARKWWDREMRDAPMPDGDDDTVATAYFDAMSERGDEFITTEMVTLDA